MSKTIAISQSNYIPWKGYFDFIAEVDEFVLYDEVQYTTRDWRNRNRIKTPQGPKWLTIPVHGSQSDSIDEVDIADNDWNEKHWQILRHIYNQAPFFSYWERDILRLYEQATFSRLSEINRHFLVGITKLLGIKTSFSWSTDYNARGDRTERLISICKQANADVYVSGPAAKAYLDVGLFNKEGITVQWMNYEDYKEYPQLYGEFDHTVSILDLLFNTGPQALDYLKTAIQVEI
ncbi:WbqC family protein [Fodinibius sp. Rm-B-1B1-1]|uniref:WbqC family protein n=1 Tax=Fodinibius alkaliphilus TaxID=3140241 RepID=UPI00315B091B